jgi:hypothetical protein
MTMIVALMVMPVLVTVRMLTAVMVCMMLIVMVPMIMMMRVIVVMMCVIMVMMSMIMMVVPMRASILGLEWGHHRLRLEAAVRQELRNVGKRGHAQAVGEDLHRDVAIAERQHEARRPHEILLAHLEHRLDIGHHFDDVAVVEEKPVVGAQQRRFRKIELDARSLAAEHEALLLRTVLELEQQRVDDLAGGFMGAEDFESARHGAIQRVRIPRSCRLFGQDEARNQGL